MDLEQLVAMPAGRQAMVVASTHPLRRKQLFDQAFARAVAERRNDPREVAALAELSLRLAEAAGEELLAARARLELANALRRLDRCREARSLLRCAEPVIRRSGSEVDSAQLVSFRSSLILQRGKVKEALADLAIVSHRPPSAVTAALWVKLGAAHRYGGQLGVAQQAYWRALRMADELDLPMIFNAASLDLAGLFLEGGRPEIGNELLDRLAPLSESVGSQSDRLNTDWLRGRMLAAHGLDEQATNALEAVAFRALTEGARGAVSIQVALDALVIAERNRGDVAGMLERFIEALPRSGSFQSFRRALRRARRGSKSVRAKEIALLCAIPPPTHEVVWLDPVAARRRHPDLSAGPGGLLRAG